ncbi:membrane protein [Sulfuriferula plumbiphila]|uniref:Membrane protein n=1 Tax=Sulfuriferula plumbiphila TaxID=171865 RepID=A0A512LAH3_9PROT|nr:OmpA family protein [Sulfuriferula plumbiphila]BBP05978.1 membrane protein [Sulfuriferula plumbiphila]GEP31131.1 membrane protein [Sulfuriferula plumbiphila]
MTATKKLIIASIAAALLPSMAMAENSTNYGYLVDSNGKVVKNNYGECWHTGYWTPAMATSECDPKLVKKEETPEPVMAAPAAQPAPQPQPAPAAVMPQKVTLSADALFDFDKSTLKPAGKTTLDDLVRDLNAAKYDEIQVTGHTDRIGSDAYNLKLSERRADSVKDYLVSKGIPANLINAKGVGKANPVTKPGECAGRKSPKVIACLQPDRRVEVEVTATKEPAPAN